MLPLMIYIYYGSEMGTGQEFAETLGSHLETQGIHNTVMDIDEFEEEDIVNQELCILAFPTHWHCDGYCDSCDWRNGSHGRY